MSFKLFKSFIAFDLTVDELRFDKLFNQLENHEVSDPHSTSWSSMGFKQVLTNEFALELTNGGHLLMIEFNERILPGSVLREEIAKRVLDLQERTGRKIGKKEYAELREDTTIVMLPKTLIRRKLVPVIIRNQRAYVFTSSVKLTDGVATLLLRALEGCTAIASVASAVQGDVGGAITTLAREQSIISEEGDFEFWSSNSLVIAGKDKQMIRVKDKDVGSDDVQQLLRHPDYKVKQIGINYGEGGDTEARFVFSDKFVFSGLKFEDVKNDKAKDAAEAADMLLGSAWIVSSMVSRITELAIEMCGGYRAPEAKPNYDVDDL